MIHIQVQHCEVCQRSKRKFDKPAPSLHPIPVSDTWCKVGVDLIELPVTSNGNRYCITLTDYFSKWAEAQPIPTKEAIHVSTFLYKMIMRHGCPEEIISDQVKSYICILHAIVDLFQYICTILVQGREFCNRIVNHLEELTGFKYRVTSAYHPQSNGLDERLNQTLKTSLQKLVNESQNDWDELIDNVLFAYRTSKQDSTKFTPFFLMYGREARLPIDISTMHPSRTAAEMEGLF